MAREVNVTTSGWRATGANVSTPQYEMTIKYEWVDNAGVKHTQSQLVRFPNILITLAGTNAGNASWVGEQIKGVILDAIRRYLGVDE
jgi:hypothetical protein